MKNKLDNPPAFPRTWSDVAEDQEGMTLLDYFAGQAMNGEMSLTDLGTPEKIAKFSYEVAQAMLKEREKLIETSD